MKDVPFAAHTSLRDHSAGLAILKPDSSVSCQYSCAAFDQPNGRLTHCGLHFAQAMLDEFRRELDALRQREDRILKLCSRQQATVTLKNREFTEAVVHLIQQCLR